MACIHNDHPVSQATGFSQVVRHQDHGDRHFLTQSGELAVKRLPRRGIDGRKWFVEQQNTWQRVWDVWHIGGGLRRGHDAHQSPSQGHALLLTA
jgi:hypothetical protein